MQSLEDNDFSVSRIDKEAWQIGNSFLKGILFEVSAHPKPGLVCSNSMGSHSDMNILTFMASSATIAPAFYRCAQAGREHQGKIEELLKTIRGIGILYEKEFLDATKGVNTQRGILFAVGLICGAAGYLSKNVRHTKTDEIFKMVSEMTQGLVSRELWNMKKSKNDKLTAGEKLYLKYQATGIRGEVEAGFPSVKNVGLPALKVALQKCNKLNDCIVHVLLSLMGTVEDTTILWRKDMNTLLEVQAWAKRILDKGSVFTKEGMLEIYIMDKEFIERNISPGGSADLVAVTIGSYLLEEKQFSVDIL
ncbi:MAG: triphosphoribosyl-dephospho-CoA synthase [Clostridia bacterium]|nr:triphosphoribosyl-dephospho-CoA synthase [Clostridia bacterium]MDD4048984.1 triphosphoribosyl-dephospho-CoA synthase [Clostridia bacterium]